MLLKEGRSSQYWKGAYARHFEAKEITIKGDEEESTTHIHSHIQAHILTHTLSN